LQVNPAALRAEDLELGQASFLQGKLQARHQYTEAISRRPPKTDRRSLRKIFGGTGNLADAEAEVDALCEHLIVEDEIV